MVANGDRKFVGCDGYAYVNEEIIDLLKWFGNIFGELFFNTLESNWIFFLALDEIVTWNEWNGMEDGLDEIEWMKWNA